MVEVMKEKLVWVDCEMTGLDPLRDKLIEIAVIVTDGSDLSNQIEGPEIVINCEQKHLDEMDEWCTRVHGKSGLTAKVQSS